MSRIRWSARSRHDLHSAFEYYKRIDQALALQIVDAVQAKADWLLDFPGAGSPIELGLRKASVSGTPYVILYRAWLGGIAVSRIHHEAENWRPR